ncbi:MAG: hypothetical protein J6U12_03510 [Candidatus Methanomethylophilaceae archaeon]|nr:hypothetical protein [Candidatus Methanomethylophilaceae archaeon]
MKKTETWITILAAIMLITGVYFIIRCLQDTIVLLEVVGFAVQALGGVILLKWFRSKLVKGVAVALMVVGVSNILVYFQYLYTDVETGSFIFAILYVVAGAVMIYYGMSLFIGIKSGSMKCIVCIAALILIEIIFPLLQLHRGMPFFDVLYEYSDILIYMLLHVMLVIILTRNEMKIPSFQKRIVKDSDVIFDQMVTDPDTYIMRSDLPKLLSTEDGPEWVHIEGSPIERELAVPLQGNKPGVELLLQKWNGDERMHLCVRTKGLGTYRIVLAMPIEQTVMNGDEGTASKVRFYGADGMFADVVIMNPEDINKGYIGILKDFSKKKKTEEEPSE